MKTNLGLFSKKGEEQKEGVRQQRSPHWIQTVPSRKKTDKDETNSAKSKHALTTPEGRRHADGRQRALVSCGSWKKKLKTHPNHDLWICLRECV